MFGNLIVGEVLKVAENAPKLAGKPVVFKGWIGKIAKVSELGVAGPGKAEFAIWPSWFVGHEPEWVAEAGAGC